MSNIKDLIRELAKGDGEAYSLVCTVDSVDKEARTVDCTPVDEGAPLLGVNLQANQGSSFAWCPSPVSAVMSWSALCPVEVRVWYC